jgi:hypothetical protein
MAKHLTKKKNTAKNNVVKKATITGKKTKYGMDKDAPFPLLELESGIPIPERGVRDPEFYNKMTEVLGSMKPKQSFAMPTRKLHTTKKIIKSHFQNYKIRCVAIDPDKKFTRVWRLA